VDSVNGGVTVNPDLAIARSVRLRKIWEVAAEAGLEREELELFGDYKAKVKLTAGASGKGPSCVSDSPP